MKEYDVYEIGVPDHYDESNDEYECDADCTIWVAVEKGINIRHIHLSNNVYIKPIPYKVTDIGIDFIMERKDII